MILRLGLLAVSWAALTVSSVALATLISGDEVRFKCTPESPPQDLTCTFSPGAERKTDRRYLSVGLALLNEGLPYRSPSGSAQELAQWRSAWTFTDRIDSEVSDRSLDAPHRVKDWAYFEAAVAYSDSLDTRPPSNREIEKSIAAWQTAIDAHERGIKQQAHDGRSN